MQVKAIKDYNDLELKRTVKADEVLEVTKQRGLTLLTAGVAQLVEETNETAGPAEDTKAGKTKKGKGKAKKEA